VQKPMIVAAGARAAMSRTIASASGLRTIFDDETVETGETFP
jgi:hypothetical protein